MIPTSADTPVFISRAPSWELQVELEQAMETAVFTSRSGLEERQQRRSRSLWTMEYSAVLQPAELAARRASAITESNAPCVVPFWTERCYTTTAIVANVVGIDRLPDADFFADGDYCYLSQNGTGQFRQIDTSSGNNLTLVALIGAVAFTTGAKIWPCRLCARQPFDWTHAGAKAGIEQFKFTTL